MSNIPQSETRQQNVAAQNKPKSKKGSKFVVILTLILYLACVGALLASTILSMVKYLSYISQGMDNLVAWVKLSEFPLAFFKAEVVGTELQFHFSIFAWVLIAVAGVAVLLTIIDFVLIAKMGGTKVVYEKSANTGKTSKKNASSSHDRYVSGDDYISEAEDSLQRIRELKENMPKSKRGSHSSVQHIEVEQVAQPQQQEVVQEEIVEQEEVVEQEEEQPVQQVEEQVVVKPKRRRVVQPQVQEEQVIEQPQPQVQVIEQPQPQLQVVQQPQPQVQFVQPQPQVVQLVQPQPQIVQQAVAKKKKKKPKHKKRAVAPKQEQKIIIQTNPAPAAAPAEKSEKKKEKVVETKTKTVKKTPKKKIIKKKTILSTKPAVSTTTGAKSKNIEIVKGDDDVVQVIINQ